MKKQITFISLSVALIMLNASCSLEKTDSENEDLKVNNSTLRNSDLGFKEGRIEDYFYNFENNVEASFFRYNPNLMANYSTYADYYSLFNEDPTTMTYRTFPDYLVAMTPVDESEYTVRNIIDSLTVLDSVVLDSVQISSTPFKNLESLEWNLDAEPSLQRYKLVNSDWVIDDTTVRYQDVFDVSAYWAVVDTPFIQNGLLFVDSSEWNDTNYVFLAEDQIVFENSFEFTKKQLSQDSLVFRINTDCNDNGTYDVAESIIQDYNADGVYEILYEFSDNNNNGIYDSGDESIQDYNEDGSISVAYEFTDQGNEIWDPSEPFYDIDSSGSYDLNEPYQDRNCNGKWDGEESFVDADESLDYSADEQFIDRGNGIFDEAEEFFGDDQAKLYKMNDKPNSLVVHWIDQNTSVILLDITVGDDVSGRWGESYQNVIEEVTIVDLQRQSVDDVDSLITLFTRKEVGHITNDKYSLDPDDYYITKSEWSNSSGGQTERFYNYHIFHEPGNLNQVTYPSYFLPRGFFFSPNEIEDGFWHKNNLESEVLYYTYNGMLRAGEVVDTSYYDTTSIAEYYVQKSYKVESDSNVVVPAGHRPSFAVAASDTVFTDCFKITQTITMTMIGTGIEFGQRVESWLVKDIGLVKSEIYIRWTEHPYDSDYTANNNYLDTLNQAWIGLNRIELNSVDIQQSNSVFRKLTQPVHSIKLKNIEEHQNFNFDPFYINTQHGIHTLDLRELSQ